VTACRGEGPAERSESASPGTVSAVATRAATGTRQSAGCPDSSGQVIEQLFGPYLPRGQRGLGVGVPVESRGQISCEFDAAGRLVGLVFRDEDQTEERARITYDEHDRPVRVELETRYGPAGLSVRYSDRDQLQRLAIDANGDGQPNQSYDWYYDAHGRVTRDSVDHDGDGEIDIYIDYDEQGRTARIARRTPDGDFEMLQVTAWDGDGRPVEWEPVSRE
jgi:hypothetical protein